MNLLRLIKRVWQALPLCDQQRWLITQVLLEPTLPLIKGGVVHSAYLREKDWRAKCIRPFHGDAFLPLPDQIKPDIVFWGVIDWGYRTQRPQHLARGLADSGYRVFYVSTSFVNDQARGFEVEPIDGNGCLFNVRLHLKGRPRIYYSGPGGADFQRLSASVSALLEWTGSRGVISIIQHPYWTDIALSVPNSKLIYDCIDYHGGFDNTGEAINLLERRLLAKSDAVVVTSQWLHDMAMGHNSNVHLIRNAAEFERFSVRPSNVFADSRGRRVIGYIGAIGSWMDIDLLDQIASAFPQCLLLLVGADEAGVRKRLVDRDNVILTGELSYMELPRYLYGMDVCVLPFRVVPLTLATNPVKVYEYLAAGKQVVAVALPELEQFGNLVAIASTHNEFIELVKQVLANPYRGSQGVRQAFAERNTWRDRVFEFEALLTTIMEEPCA